MCPRLALPSRISQVFLVSVAAALPEPYTRLFEILIYAQRYFKIEGNTVLTLLFVEILIDLESLMEFCQE